MMTMTMTTVEDNEEKDDGWKVTPEEISICWFKQIETTQL